MAADSSPEVLYRAYRTHEGRKTAEIFRWDKEQAKKEIAHQGNIIDPEWEPRNKWSDDEEAIGRHGESKVVVTKERVE